jgi:hypothetical protein
MFNKIIIAVSFICAFASAQSVTGYLNPSNLGSWSRLNTEQALNSMTTVHSCVDADSVAVRPGVKWGASYMLKTVYNNSGSVQIYTIVDSSAQGLDTFSLKLQAYSMSFPLPYVKLLSGAVVDSTLYIRQYIGR